jgi:hypothetical protein
MNQRPQHSDTRMHQEVPAFGSFKTWSAASCNVNKGWWPKASNSPPPSSMARAGKFFANRAFQFADRRRAIAVSDGGFQHQARLVIDPLPAIKQPPTCGGIDAHSHFVIEMRDARVMRASFVVGGHFGPCRDSAKLI